LVSGERPAMAFNFHGFAAAPHDTLGVMPT